jgi:hypothetical protein
MRGYVKYFSYRQSRLELPQKRRILQELAKFAKAYMIGFYSLFNGRN